MITNNRRKLKSDYTPSQIFSFSEKIWNKK
nr:MAG TPA: hypothetical protein [Caudoviricetes sp.]